MKRRALLLTAAGLSGLIAAGFLIHAIHVGLTLVWGPIIASLVVALAFLAASATLWLVATPENGQTEPGGRQTAPPPPRSSDEMLIKGLTASFMTGMRVTNPPDRHTI